MIERHFLHIELTGKTGEIDGYLEVILGAFLISGLLAAQPRPKARQRKDGTSEIEVELVLFAPVLGHLGEDDLK